jgi:hypothetical protein
MLRSTVAVASPFNAARQAAMSMRNGAANQPQRGNACTATFALRRPPSLLSKYTAWQPYLPVGSGTVQSPNPQNPCGQNTFR